jgi:hypothetical protein
MRRQISTLRTFCPENLYFHIDGPRKESTFDSELIQECLKAIEGIDWKTSVKVLRRSQNLGCKEAVVSALEWVFESEENAIVLEDDIDFDISFITFSQINLVKNKENNNFLAICGYNPIVNQQFQESNKITNLVSIYPSLWGWATWKKKWQDNYDKNPKLSLLIVIKLLKNNNYNLLFTCLLLIHVIRIKLGKLDTWDYQVIVSSSLNQKRFIYPTKSLTSNLGFREDATHTKTPLGKIEIRNESNRNKYEKEFDKIYRKMHIKIFFVLLINKVSTLTSNLR